eukprot:11223626-Lingulodinium_polyedra.AAC.1
MGLDMRQHGAQIAPQLCEHVAANSSGEAAVAKEPRKAREAIREARKMERNNKKPGLEAPAGEGAVCRRGRETAAP